MAYYRNEVLVQGPKLVVIAGRFRVDGTNSPDLVVDGCPKTALTEVTRTDVGEFTVTLPQVGGGWPTEMISCILTVGVIDSTDAALDEIHRPRYVIDSYDPSTGAFDIMNSLSSDTSGATLGTAIGEPVDNSEIHYVCFLRNSNDLDQT